MAQDVHLPGMGEVCAEPVKVEAGIHQLDEHMTPSEEQDRKPFAQPPSGSAGKAQQRARILTHRVGRRNLTSTGARHMPVVQWVVVVLVQVEIAEPLLRSWYPLPIVGLAVVRKARSKREALGEPAGATSG